MLGGYIIFNPPFEGGFCKVYKALRLDRPGKFFAIKTPIDSSNINQIERLKREYKVLSKIKHPHLIKLVEERLNSKPPFLVFEYLAGGNLRSKVGKLNYNSILLMTYQISGALSAIHKAGGFHRDIKPDNILISPDGSFILSDVNIGNVPSDKSTMTYTIGGTRGYIDPWVVNKKYDPLADIWSFGITITELLAGIKPNRLVNLNGFALKISNIPIENKPHRRAIYNLIYAMLTPKRSKRPDASIIQNYAWVLLNGGQLPILKIKPSTKVLKKKEEIDGIIATGVVVGLLLVGIAAFFFSKE